MGERRLGAASMQARVALLRRPAVVARRLHHMIALLDLQIGRPVGLPPRRLGAASTRAKAAQQRHALQAAKAEGICIQRLALSALVHVPSSGACELEAPLLEISVLP